MTENNRIPKKKFAYDDLEERPALEPPCPSSIYAKNKIPASYVWSALDHPDIVNSRVGKLPDVSVAGKAAGWSDLRIDWNVDPKHFPESFPYFVRGRDSVRTYITQLFTSEIA
eukprot:scaffold15944_cov248-Ochromonas_danica.AAC.1